MVASTHSIRAPRKTYRIAGHPHRLGGTGRPVSAQEEACAEAARRRRLREWLDEMDAVHGPVTAEEADEARRLLNGAFG